LQEPFGAIEKIVVEVTSPSELSHASRDWEGDVCEPPDGIVAEAGESTRWSSGPAVTPNEALALFPPLTPVTVCEPAIVAVHALDVQAPFGAIENVVTAVTSPSELTAASKPCAV